MRDPKYCTCTVQVAMGKATKKNSVIIIKKDSNLYTIKHKKKKKRTFNFPYLFGDEVNLLFGFLGPSLRYLWINKPTITLSRFLLSVV